MLLMLLKPYFHGMTILIGGPLGFCSTSPYMPTVTSVRSFIASSMRNPSTYGY